MHTDAVPNSATMKARLIAARLIAGIAATPCAVVVAQTLEGLAPSIGVLLKRGFVATASPEPGVLVFTLRRSDGRPPTA